MKCVRTLGSGSLRTRMVMEHNIRIKDWGALQYKQRLVAVCRFVHGTKNLLSSLSGEKVV